jgi:hypothetical protein
MRLLKMSAFLGLSSLIVLVLGGVIFTADARARLGSEPAATAQQPSACQSAMHRAFDFWVGEWVVYNPGGDVAGRNTIELQLDGCALHESWESSTGGTGHSYTFYDAAADKWHQTWIDSNGGALYVDGEWTGEAMVLGDASNRITWTKIANGGVRQHWEVTTDGGATWSTSFDGQYVAARQE